MWIAITVISIVALVVLIATRVVSQPPRAADSDPHEQPTTTHPTPDEFPEPGSHESPHRSDGSPIPGSEEDRNEHGRR